MMENKKDLMPKLVFLFFITTSIVTTLTLSKYESAMAGSTSAKVAAFVVDAVGNGGDTLEIDCNQENPSVSYDIIVSNKMESSISQVGIKYNVIVEFSEVLPTGMEISLSTDDETITYSGGQTNYVFENVGQFTASIEENNTHTLTLTGNTSVKTGFEGKVAFYVEAVQID